MDRCPNCGNKLSEIDVLCPKCGTVVEVIKAKNNVPSSLETATESIVKETAPAQKKDIPKYFNVYYEDLPDEDSEDSADNVPESADEASEQPDSFDLVRSVEKPEPYVGTKPATEPETYGIPKAYEQPKSYGIPKTNEQPESYDRFKAAAQPESIHAFTPESYSQEENNKKSVYSDITTAKTDGENDYDYSPRYLENLKNLNLPEIEDISNFDPEEYMREYKYKKILAEQAAQGGSSASAKKQWLELEEAEANLNTELEKVRENVQKQAEQPEIAQRRYRGAQDSRTERRRDYIENERDITERTPYSAERNPDIAARRPEAAEEISQMPADNKRPRKQKVLSMILFWVVISVAIFFGFLYLDNGIKYTSGTEDNYRAYDTFIYSITNGQVDLDPGNL